MLLDYCAFLQRNVQHHVYDCHFKIYINKIRQPSKHTQHKPLLNILHTFYMLFGGFVKKKTFGIIEHIGGLI